MPQTGLKALQETIEKNKQKFAGGGGGRLNYLTWKDKDSHIVRFLTDDVVTTDFYEWVECNDTKKRDFICAPSYYSDVPGWQGEDWVRKYNGQVIPYGKGKELEPAKVRNMTAGLVVVREELKKDGKVIAQDHFEETEVDGKKYPSRSFFIVKQANGNFWDNILFYYGKFGTICDRDYLIERKGDDKDTKYHFMPFYEDPALPDEQAVQEAYGYGGKRDKDDPKRFLYVPRTMAEWAEQYASEDRAKYWLSPKDSSEASSTESGSSVASSAGVTVDQADDYEELRRSLMPNN